jgi:hypothetical protein
VAMPRTDRFTVQATLTRPAHRGSRSPVCAAVGEADEQLAVTPPPSGDALLTALLALLNESVEMERTLQASLDLMTTALGGRIGEIWLRPRFAKGS